jgi:hypothetical protein
MSDFNRLPSRDALAALQRRQREEGFVYPLAATSIGQDTIFEAHVHRLNTADRASIEMLPDAIQRVVWDGVTEFQKLQKKAKDAESLMGAAKQNEQMLVGANAFCVAAFVDPPLVMTEAELATKPDAYLVDDIAAEDRLSFFMACLDADHPAARNLKSFRPEPSPDVPDREARPVDAFPSIRPAEYAN